MVTGASGYVGAYSVKALLDAAHRVRLLVRDPAKARRVLRAIGVGGRLDCVQGDMTDEAAVLRALAGCDAVLHCAALVSTHAGDEREMHRVNPLGTALVIGHAVRRGLDPVVHCSSVTAVLRPGVARLTSELPPGTLTRGYAGAKVACERYVRKLQDAGAPVVITYPGSVSGPAAGAVLGEATQGIAGILAIGLMPTRDGAMTLIDARDLGDLHAATMVPGQGPRRYMCGGHYLPPADLANQLQALTGQPVRVLGLPGSVLRGAGRVVDLVARALPGLNSPFTHEAAVYLTWMPRTDDAAVGRELGVSYRPVADTLRESILAAHAAGLLSEAQIGKLAGRSRPRR